LRNCVYPELGLLILDCAMGIIRAEKAEQKNLFSFLEEERKLAF